MKNLIALYSLLMLVLNFPCAVTSMHGQSFLDNLTCIQQADKQDLQLMFTYFNDYLEHRYGLKDAPGEDTYRQFAQETGNLHVAPEDLITENFSEIIAKCAELSLYQDFYQGPSRHSQSEIYACLWSALNNEELKLGLQGLKDARQEMSLSPSMVAAGYVGVNDFRDEGTQLMFSLDVFYPILHLYSAYQEMQKNRIGVNKN